MCHHYESRDLTALRERLEAAEAAAVEDEPPAAELEGAEGPDADDRLPPIQPSD